MKKIKQIMIISLTLFLVGCAYAPRPINMVPRMEKDTYTNTNKTFKVEMVFGGEESDPIFKGSRIDNSSFMTALTIALENSGLFAKINPLDNVNYFLSATILSQDQPLMGLDMTVTLIVGYTLFDGTGETEIWHKDIVSKYTAAFGDALIGSTRLKKANEGSVRNNIKLLIEELAELDL